MLEAYREQIDAIDAQIVSLLEERFDQVAKVADYKRRHRLPVLDAQREAELLEKLKRQRNSENKPQSKINWDAIESVYQSIFTVSRSAQTTWMTNETPKPKTEAPACLKASIPVAYFGLPGSYTSEAMNRWFDGRREEPTKGISCQDFESVALAVETGSCRYGVLPIENSSTGSIYPVYDLLGKGNLQIVGEIKMPIEHYLMARKGVDRNEIKRVYSHSQALSQSRSHLKNKKWELISVESSSHGAKRASEESDSAAIGNRAAAEIYGLEILEGPISDFEQNQTRFIVIGKGERSEDVAKANVIGLSFQIPHICGQLYQILEVFYRCNLNLLKIESRPIGDKPFEYQFYVDFEGALDTEAFRTALKALNEKTQWLKILGAWEKSV